MLNYMKTSDKENERVFFFFFKKMTQFFLNRCKRKGQRQWCHPD